MRLGLLQRLATPDRDQRVLQRSPPAIVAVDIAGCDAGHPEPLGEQRQPTIPSPIPPPIGPLQLNPKPIPPKSPKQPPSKPLPLSSFSPFKSPSSDPIPSTPGKANEPLRVLLHLLESRPSLRRGPPSVVPRMRMGSSKQPAQIPIPGRILNQQSEMPVPAGGWRRRGDPHLPRRWGWVPCGDRTRRPNPHRQLRPGYSPDTEALTRMRELHRPPHPIVIGKSKSRIPMSGSGSRQLRRNGSPVEKGKGRMSMQLDVHQARCRYQR